MWGTVFEIAGVGDGLFPHELGKAGVDDHSTCTFNESSVEAFGYTVLGRRVWRGCFKYNAFGVEIVFEFAENELSCVVDTKDLEGIALLSDEEPMEILE